MEITLPSKPKVVHREGNLAVFEIENLYPGYGMTLGNALRRVLLSSLPGAAISMMRVAGVTHEFTTVPGAMEDVVTLSLNVKQVRFRLFGEDPQIAKLKVKGERNVTAANIEVPSQLEVVNPDAHIATLTNKRSELDIELTVEHGIGYVPVEMRQSEKLPIGTIAIDAIFTPVRKTNFSVQNMRVGERTDFNLLRFDIETDGSISPEEAFAKAARILVDQFSQFLDIAASSLPVKEKQSAESEKPADAAKQKIEDTALSSRVKKALQASGIKTVGGLARQKKQTLLELEGLGERGSEEIEAFLKAQGFDLKR